jgi:hypothetical protein
MVLYLAMDSIPILRLSNPILFLLPIHPTRPWGWHILHE